MEAQNAFKIAEQEKFASNLDRPEAEGGVDNKSKQGSDTETSVVKFSDERWKKGTWDLNMFTKDSNTQQLSKEEEDS